MTIDSFASENSSQSQLNPTSIGFTPNPNPVYFNINNDSIKLFLNEEEWRQTRPSSTANFYSGSNMHLNADENLQFAWEVIDGLSINFNVFEDTVNFNNSNRNFITNSDNNSLVNYQALDNSHLHNSINRQVSGYTFGVESELGLGKGYKLGLNVDIGQIYGADLLGFGHKEISTTSFGVGIRNSSFGASVNTDIYLENREANLNQSSLGFELDWHFSEKGKLSFGSKKPIEEQNPSNSSIDDFTGNVQYIKFQHNL